MPSPHLFLRAQCALSLCALAFIVAGTVQAADGGAQKPRPQPPSATQPATQKGNGYDWMARHEEILKIKDGLKPEIVFIGDSITHHWGGLPAGRLKLGEKVLTSAFAGRRILNLGFGSDRTQQAIWRLQHGELDGLVPSWVVVNIGTNNTSDGNTAEEIVAGIRAVCGLVREKTPQAHVVLMAVFPRDKSPTAKRRLLIDAINAQLKPYAAEAGFTYLDIGRKFLDEKGNIIHDLMPDNCHPSDKGYRIWADALLPELK